METINAYLEIIKLSNYQFINYQFVKIINLENMK